MSRPFVVVGESLVDILVPVGAAPTEAAGGSPLNVAVGLARLDVPTLMITTLGDDPHGRLLHDHAHSSGVQLSGSSVVPGSRTSTSTARLDHDNTARYEFDLTWELASQELPDATGLHVGSLGTLLQPGRAAVVDVVRQANERDMFVSYDPNIRPAFLMDPRQAWHDVLALAGASRLVKVSDEDLRLLRPDIATGDQATADHADHADRDLAGDLAGELLVSETTELVIVTFGGKGAAAFTDDFSVRVDAPEVDVIDTVGAGDSFMAASLALLFDWELTTAGPGALGGVDADRVRILLAGAMAAAAVTCSRRGARPPTRRELSPAWPFS